MAVTVQFYIFAKRENSTKQPSGIAAFTANCELKNPTSVINPEIILNISTNPTAMNYAYIEAFDRYYFVEDWTWVNGLWSARLTEDVLASYKSSIGNSSQYITRAADAFNGNLIDTIYPAKSGYTVSTASASVGTFATSVESGWYVVGIVNEASSTIGGCSYYVLSPQNMRDFTRGCYGSINWAGIDESEISKELQKALINPLQYVVNAFWLPFKPNVSTGTLFQYPVGYWGISCESYGAAMSSSNIVNFPQKSITIPKHPQYNATTGARKYLNNAPYSEYHLTNFMFGQLPLDAQTLYNNTAIVVNLACDCTTGETVLTLTGNNDNALIGFYTGKMGTPVELGGMRNSPLSLVATSMANIGRTAINSLPLNLGDKFSTSLSALAGVGDAVASSYTSAMTAGSVGGNRITMDGTFRLEAKFLTVADEDNTEKGRPYNQISTIKNHSGFIKCSDGHIEIAGTQMEKETIMNYLENGFFYE